MQSKPNLTPLPYILAIIIITIRHLLILLMTYMLSSALQMFLVWKWALKFFIPQHSCHTSIPSSAICFVLKNKISANRLFSSWKLLLFGTNHRYSCKFHWFPIINVSREKPSQLGSIFMLIWCHIRILRSFFSRQPFSDIFWSSCRLSNVTPVVPWLKLSLRFTPWCASQRPNDFIHRKAQKYHSFLNFESNTTLNCSWLRNCQK